MATVTERLVERMIRHAVLLERMRSGEVRRFVGDLNSNVLADLDDITLRGVDRLGRRGPASLRTQAFATMTGRLRDRTAELMGRWNRDLAASVDDLARSEGAFNVRAMRQAIGAGSTVENATAPALRAIRTSRPFQGRLLREVQGELGRDVFVRIRGAVRTGLMNGETIDQIMGRVRGFQGHEVTRNDAARIVRTATTHVSARATEAVAAANPKLFDRVQWQAILDSRTSDICLDLHGNIYPLGKGPRPPAHWNCRSDIVAVRRGEGGFVLTGQEWLERQSKSTQDTVLGPGRAAVFRRGSVPFGRFVTRSLEPLTLREVEALEVRLEAS